MQIRILFFLLLAVLLFWLISACNTPTGPTSLSCNISVNPRFIFQGESVVLSWTSNGATSAEIEGVLRTAPLNGSRVVTPQETSTYIMRVSNTFRRAECRVTVNVSKTPR